MRRQVYRLKLPTRDTLPIQEVVVIWLLLAAVLIALFGAGVRMISRNDSRPAEERRVPAGHSGA